MTKLGAGSADGYRFALQVTVNRLVRMSSRALITALVAIIAAPVSAESRHSHPKTDLAIQRAVRGGAGTLRVIISVADPNDRLAIQKALESHGDSIKSEHPLVGAFAAEVHAGDVSQLANYPGVQFVSVDAPVSAGAATYGSDWGSSSSGSTDTTTTTSTAGVLRSTLGLPAVAGSGPTGRGIGVAVIDSGISPSLDLGFRITGFFDFTKGGVPSMPYDDYGHGTHIAGLIGSNGLLSGFALQGVAPEVNFVGLK